MSWTTVADPYADFVKQAREIPLAPQFQQPWELTIWEVTNDFPQGRWEGRVATARRLQSHANLRIVFAPLDLPQNHSATEFLELFRVLHIPRDFVQERTQSVSHSFGTRTDGESSSSWFHFLCKNIEILQDGAGFSVDNREARILGRDSLPQADYSYHRSGFFLRSVPGESVTLVCFGATPKVRARLNEFINGGSWYDVFAEPHVLFDLVLDGIFLEVDTTVWNMNRVFGGMEHQILTYAREKTPRKLRMSQITDFTGLHNCAKHVIHIAEAVESSLLTVERMVSLVKEPAASSAERLMLLGQLKHSLQHRRSLFESTKLRLGSLQKRVDNAITLCFNLVQQQDSLILMQDSSSMKTIATITMIFLPTTGVATVLGSQLFFSTEQGDGWQVKWSPLFMTMWYVSVPLTIVTLALAYVFHWWNHHDAPQKKFVVKVLNRATSFRRTDTEMASDSRLQLVR